MPPQARWRTPISFENLSCFLQHSPFIRMSAIWSPVGVYTGLISPPSTLWHKKWCRTSMCLVQSWNLGFLTMAMADWMSMWRMVGFGCGDPNLDSNHLSHTTSFAACTPAMYSASILESAREVCFFELQLMAMPASEKKNPDVDLQLFMLLAQLASMCLVRVELSRLPCWKNKQLSLVAWR
jgi:hypothetical protein